MPQMMPLNWLFLFLFFSSIFFVNLITTYFIKLPRKLYFNTSEPYTPINSPLNIFFWKW